MIRCKKCGTLNEADATFCSQCDAFLEWSGESVVDDGDSTPAESSEATPPADGQPPAARPSAAPPSPRQSSTAATDQVGTDPPARKPQRGAATPARKAKAPTPTKVEKPKPGERVCPTCGTGNDPERKFCRRCGNGLGLAPVETAPTPEPKKRHGSSRLSGILRRGKQEAFMAGQRPESMLSSRGRWRPGSGMMVFGLLGIVGLGSLASYYYMPGVSDTVDEVIRTVQNRIGDRSEVNITNARAHSSPGYPALNMIDGGSNTWWAGPVSDNGRWLIDFELQEASDLLQINIDGGADGEAYDLLGRPREIQIRADGELSQRFELSDTADQQPVDVDLQGVKKLRLIVHSQWVGLDGGDEIAIREVDVVGPKG